ncbi:CaiB/BaiF CoA transferase family protein [Chelatococcus asaccharovorans]|uniref:CaiB/BaiF CoA transferase family protein n=1 Tax=Chelatococcus asaccharovorans TaxID=28210 RepID=UPI0022650EE9|nr:CoA transferase [Chelatococcus asaccharovorans]
MVGIRTKEQGCPLTKCRRQGGMTVDYPLEGITVLDLSQIYNGPYATFLMAMAGATIIKIEPPGGESLRRRGVVGGAALPFAMLNGCKQSIVLDLKSAEDKAIFLDLVPQADVVVENFAPGTMDRLGLSASVLQAINPKLIYAASSGFGSDGPYRNYPAMDLTIQALSGVMSTTGFPDRPPVKAGPALCDFFSGVHLYGAIATALFERERTGKARCVEVAMQDAVYPSLSSSLGLHWGSGGQGEMPPRTGNRHAGLAEAPYNVYPTSDGWIAIICVGEQHWRSLAKAMQRPDLADDPRFGTLKQRVENMDAIDTLVGEWTSRYPRQALFELLMEHQVACAPVRELDEVVNDPNMHARGALQWQDHPELGRIVVQHSPLRFAGLPLRPMEPSRKLGADTAAVLTERLGAPAAASSTEVKKQARA